MNNISKLGEDIEKRLQTIESTQEESNKIIIEFVNRQRLLSEILSFESNHLLQFCCKFL